jgi:hypothetical protein
MSGSARARTPAEELPGARLARRAAVRRTPSGVLRCAPARAKGTRAGLGELREGTVQRDRYPGHPMPKLGETSLPVRSGPAWGRRCDAPGVSGHQGHRDTGTSGRKRPCRITRLEARIWPRPPPIRSNAPLTSAVRMSTPDAPPSRARWGAWPHGGCDQTAPSKGGDTRTRPAGVWPQHETATPAARAKPNENESHKSHWRGPAVVDT